MTKVMRSDAQPLLMERSSLAKCEGIRKKAYAFRMARCSPLESCAWLHFDASAANMQQR